MELRLGRHALANGVLLAPLSGISDVPFRRLARRFGAGLVFSEMVASGEFVSGSAESALRAMRDGKGLHAVQLAGREPIWMERAAERLVDLGADIIDINMGCPAKKVVGGRSGSALMREPDLALRLIEATVKGAGPVPVTLKMRLGWDHDTINAPLIAARAESAGVRMVTVHGRTRQQFYQGRADWQAIADVKAAVSIPLVANGDLTEAAEVPKMLRESKADAVMIGRGAVGRPWLPGLVADPTTMAELETVALADLIGEHYEAMLSHYGRDIGVRHARKHLERYCGRFGQDVTNERRQELLSSRDPQTVIRTIRAIFGTISIAEAEAAAALPEQVAA